MRRKQRLSIEGIPVSYLQHWACGMFAPLHPLAHRRGTRRLAAPAHTLPSRLRRSTRPYNTAGTTPRVLCNQMELHPSRMPTLAPSYYLPIQRKNLPIAFVARLDTIDPPKPPIEPSSPPAVMPLAHRCLASRSCKKQQKNEGSAQPSSLGSKVDWWRSQGCVPEAVSRSG